MELQGINYYLFIFIFRVFRALNCSFHAISRFRIPRYSLCLREKVVKLDYVTNWFNSNKIKVSNLNPTEHLWEELGRRISDTKVKNSKFSNIAGQNCAGVRRADDFATCY